MTNPQSQPSSGAGARHALVLADRATLLQGNVLGLMAGTAVITLMVAALLRDTVAGGWLLGWLALQLGNAGFNAWAGWRVAQRPATSRNAARRLRNATVASGISGALWLAGLLMFWPGGSFEQHVLLLFLVTGLTSGALHSLSAYLPAFYAFFVPCVLGVLVVTVWQGGLLNWVIAATALIYGVTSGRFAASMHRTLVDSLRRRHEIAELAVDLQRQKELAEAASVSKSRFLAAASHDLRQPVHALSLFVGALSQQPPPQEAARLLDHVRATVEAMGAMFNALLDMSRLDAGMVQPQRQPVDLRQLLERIAEDEGAIARAKGLQLRIDMPALVVHSDPVLLERIVRNLVANAVRYTERGGVLLAARARAGYAVLRVADTGVGIPVQRQGEVFQEFVQLHNPERDRAKGLGLGLAIVRRLVDLLGLPLSLRSVEGRGTMFTLRMPLAAAEVAAAGPVAAPAAHSSLVRGDVVLVVDDDQQVRDAMQALLSGWGCAVLAAGSLAELLPQLMGLSVLPRLLVCDYRLRGAENGLAVIAQLRADYNEDIPAILITGDTAPERLREAHDSGLALLHKPVTPQALLEAIMPVLARHDSAPGDSDPDADAAIPTQRGAN